MIALNSIDSALLIKTPDENQWVDIVRAMKPGAHLLLFSNVKNHYTGTIAAEDAGLEIRDTLAYVFSDSENGGGNAAMKLIAMARKPLQGTVAENVLEWGTGGLNIDKCRVEALEGRPLIVIDPKPEANGVVYAGRLNSGSGFDGGSKAIGETTEGRWPANLLHCGSPAVKEMFPSCKPSPSPNRPIVRGKRTALVYGGQTNAEGTMGYGYGDEGSAARFFYAALTLNNLVKYLLKLITPPGGTVLTSFQDFDLLVEAAKAEGFIVLRQDG